MDTQKENDQQFLVEQIKSAVRSVQIELAVKDDAVPVRIGVEGGGAQAIRKALFHR